MTNFCIEVLAVGPHPDDVEIFCGGLMAGMAAAGYRTGIVDLTRGEMGSRGTTEIRAQEADAAGRVLGVSLRENLSLPDAALSQTASRSLSEDDASRVIVEMLRRLRPEILLIPLGRDRHPDHQAAHVLMTRALFLAALRKFHPSSIPFTPRCVLLYPMWTDVEPTFVVDVSSAYSRKMDAVRCHASQVAPDPLSPPTRVGSSLSLTSLEARDRFYGARIGVSHGEPYVLRETPGLVDPVDHFRRNALGPALFLPDRA
jgi:bacillithiol biosynthesis deacetylase BshB1